ncbi:MAG: nickel-dependent lactate racemase family protein [Anaerolineae bacterium]
MTTRVHLAYGKTGLDLDLPGQVTILERKPEAGVADEAMAIRAALRAPIGSAPLRDLVRPSDSVAIVFSDITRPMPSDRVLPVLLAELDHVPDANITLINALGTHRANTAEELRRMLGPGIVDRYRVVQHDAWDEAGLATVGVSERGYPLKVSCRFLDADVRILTGFVEPHFFAGFSGGPKAVLPGVAGIETIMRNHDFEMAADPGTTWLEVDTNRMYREVERTALLAKPTFLLNVTLNPQGRISGVFAGDMLAAHRQAREAVRASAMLPVREPFDVVVTSNGGYPLDLNLYQAIKGVSAAARVVRKGGAIIMAAQCWDGLPEHGRYAELLCAAESPEALLEHVCNLSEPIQDQWQAQIQAQLQLHADVYVFSELSPKQVTDALLLRCDDIAGSVARLIEEKGPRVAVMPEGPFVVPTLVG